MHHDVVGPFAALVDRRKDFLPQAMSRLHLVTVAAAVPRVGARWCTRSPVGFVMNGHLRRKRELYVPPIHRP